MIVAHQNKLPAGGNGNVGFYGTIRDTDTMRILDSMSACTGLGSGSIFVDAGAGVGR